MKYLIYSILCAFLMIACNNKNNNRNDSTVDYSSEVYDMQDDNSNDNRLDVDSLGYYGVYEGARFIGGETVKANLILYDNNRYVIQSVDFGNDTRSPEEHGTYLIFGDLLTLKPDLQGTYSYYKTDEEGLTEVDENEQVIPVQHATSFKLIRK